MALIKLKQSCQHLDKRTNLQYICAKIYRYNVKGKITERWLHKATGLKPEGQDSRVAGSYLLMTLSGRFYLKAFLFMIHPSNIQSKCIFKQQRLAPLSLDVLQFYLPGFHQINLKTGRNR